MNKDFIFFSYQGQKCRNLLSQPLAVSGRLLERRTLSEGLWLWRPRRLCCGVTLPPRRQRQLGDESAATPLRRASLATRPILLPPSKSAQDAAAQQDGAQPKPLTEEAN